MCFINVIIKDAGDVQNVKLIFFIYLVNTTCSYFMAYKVTLLNAYQKAYKNNEVLETAMLPEKDLARALEEDE